MSTTRRNNSTNSETKTSNIKDATGTVASKSNTSAPASASASASASSSGPSTTVIVIVIVAIIFLLAVGGLVGFLIWRKKKKNKEADSRIENGGEEEKPSRSKKGEDDDPEDDDSDEESDRDNSFSEDDRSKAGPGGFPHSPASDEGDRRGKTGKESKRRERQGSENNERNYGDNDADFDAGFDLEQGTPIEEQPPPDHKGRDKKNREPARPTRPDTGVFDNDVEQDTRQRRHDKKQSRASDVSYLDGYREQGRRR